LRDLIWEKTHHKKRAGGVAQGVGPEFKPKYHIHTQNIPAQTHFDFLGLNFPKLFLPGWKLSINKPKIPAFKL
jgi:hypothetical protein